jgi:hypothetical protein
MRAWFLALCCFAFAAVASPPAAPTVPPPTLAAFELRFIDHLRRVHPDWTVTRKGPGEYEVGPPGGAMQLVYLDNAHRQALQSPADADAVIARHVAALQGTRAIDTSQPIDLARIVPIVKDRAWSEGVARTLAERGGKAPKPLFQEPLNDALTVHYAEDAPKRLRYLTEADLAAWTTRPEALRVLAQANLRRDLTDIQVRRGNGLAMLTAGGTFEASLLLLDFLWTEEQIGLPEPWVVAVPARDLLLVTSLSTPAMVERLRDIAQRAHRESAYALTPELFVRREGKWVLLGR